MYHGSIDQNWFKGMTLEDISRFVKECNALKFEQAKPRGRGILFLPTNGAGLGHIVRLLSIARRIRRIDPEKEIIFFTTSSAVYLVDREGFTGYYLPPKNFFPEGTTPNEWNVFLEELLGRLLDFYSPEILVFDGAFPYGGIIRAMDKIQGLKKVWLNRGKGKPEAEVKSKDKEIYFDYVIKPGEAGDTPSGPLDRYDFPPVIYLDKSELLDRKTARRQLGVPDRCKLIFLQMGVGIINDITPSLSAVQFLLRKRRDLFVVLGESIIGDHLNIHSKRVKVIRDFPVSRFFNAFDAAISACGYNTFHELMYFGIPSILIPNPKTIKDDQEGRAMRAVKAGAGILWDGVNAESLEIAVNYVLKHRNAIKRCEKEFAPENGARRIAEFLISL